MIIMMVGEEKQTLIKEMDFAGLMVRRREGLTRRQWACYQESLPTLML